MHPVALILGLASGGALALAIRSRLGSAQLMAMLMVMLWAAANMLAVMDSADFHALDLLALVDLPVACLAFALWLKRREAWQAAMTTFLALRLPLHVAAGIGAMDWVEYLHMINALYLAALVCIGWKGGVDAVVSDLRDYLLRFLHRGMAAHARMVGQEAS